MPYDPENPPEKLEGHGFSAKQKKQWVEVFNSCWKKNHDEGLCHAEAWSVANKSKKKYNKKESSQELNYIKTFVRNLINDKEKQIKIASNLLGKDICLSLRDELQSIKNKYSQFIDNDPLIETDITESSLQQNEISSQDNIQNIIPGTEEELNDVLFNSIADSFTTVINEKDEPVFDVSFPDRDTIVVKYSSEKGGIEKDPFVFQNMQQFMKPIFDIIDKVGFGEENPESKKQSLINELKEPIQMYRDSLETLEDEEVEKKGKKVLIYKRSDDSLKIASQIYDLLKNHGLAGPIADRDYKEIAEPEIQQDINTTGEQVVEAKNKSFNLRKHADKVFDTIREKAVQQTDPQYQSVHGKHALPWYEEAYIPEPCYKKNIMDKYYPEHLTEDGEYRGGYINDRFTVHHNTEGNSLHIKPGEKNSPDRVESYSTERRMEEMRKNNKRGYTPSEGSKTEQQTKETLASKKHVISVSEDHGLYKIVCGAKVTYLDTPQQVKAFKEIIQGLLNQGYKIISNRLSEDELPKDKKKIAQTVNTTPAIPSEGVTTLDQESNAGVSPENPLLSIVNELRKKNPNADINSLVQAAIADISASQTITADELERFRIETLRALGFNVQRKDYGQMEDVDRTEKGDTLAAWMGE